MTGSVRSSLDAATEQLARAGVESPRHDAEGLLAWVRATARGQPRAEAGLDDETRARFATAVARRCRREPLQHITGRAPFRYLELDVGPGVFVPRPETEVMAGVAVEELARLARSGVERPHAVDLCSGSGAVALALAAEVSQSQVTAVELSEEATAYARRNVHRLGLGERVDVRLGDARVAAEDLAGLVHVVTANPPYIPLEAYESVAPEARDFDPPMALWSGADGLEMIRAVAVVAARLLVEGGLLLCEHADVQGEAATMVLHVEGSWQAVSDRCDLAGRPRFVSARRVAPSSAATGTMGR